MVSGMESAESELRLGALFDSIPLGIAYIGGDGRVQMANARVEALTGYSAGEIRAIEFVELLHPSDRESFKARFDELLRGEIGSCTLENRCAHKNGSTVWVRSGITAMKDIPGKTARVVAMIEDITERKKDGDELRTLKRAVEQASSIIAITDIAGIVEYINPRFTDVTGYKPEEVAGRSIRFLNSSWHTKEFYDGLWTTVKLGHVWQGEMRNRKKNGEFYWEESAIAPVKDADGMVAHFIKIGNDITARKQAERDLLRAKEEAEAASLAKSIFLANMSHELRTPLNAIIGFSQVLQEDFFGPLTEKQRQYVDNILSSGRHLLALITDILDISKIEAGEMRLDCSKLRLATLVENSLDIIRHRTARQGIELSFQADAVSAGLEIEVDEVKIRQIMFNILSNAAKFTPGRGSVKVRMESSENEVRISVEDTGIGIAPENQPYVFDPFYQVRGEHQKWMAGTGLGLSLTKRMVELHGGRVWLASEGEGKGATFTFSIPLAGHPEAC
jgi:PAS domain S-box-containing protein